MSTARPRRSGWCLPKGSAFSTQSSGSAIAADPRPASTCRPILRSNGDLLASAQDPVTPPSLFLVRPAAAPELLKRAPQAFDSTGLVVTRHETASPDGTRIPYVQIGPPGETGEAPVHLSGYGGFGIS